MDFGKVNESELNNIDFTLPDDHADTERVLAEAKKKKVKTKVYVGGAKWGRKEWVGKIYPLKTKEKDFFNYYVKQFNCIELNTTHYRIYPPDTIKGWKGKAGRDFKFCPKFYQGISHFKRLKNCERETKEFLNSTKYFEENLGTYFLQMPPNFAPKRLPDLEKYLKSLPKDIGVSLELRHKDWFKDGQVYDETFAILKELGIGSVITDTAAFRELVHMRLSNSTAFIRFVGNSLHKTDYIRIDQWVNRMKKWISHGIKTIYFMMHMHDERYSPELCAYTIKELNKKCKLNLKGPEFLGE